MNVVGDRTSLEQGALLIFNDAANVGVEFIPDVMPNTASRFFVEKTRCTRIWARDCGMGFALSGLVNGLEPDSQGVALGYLILPLWGGGDAASFHNPAPSGLL